MPEYNSNIRALNDVVVDYGLPGGHHFEIDALNAWAVHLGGSGGHQFNIDALNEIIGLVGGSGSFQFEIDAYNEISRALGGGSDFRFVEDALSEISDLPVFEGGGGEPYVAEAVHFGGATSLARGGALTGASGHDTMIFSGWLKSSSFDGSYIFGSFSEGMTFLKLEQGKFNLEGASLVTGNSNMLSTATYADAWQHVLGAVDLTDQSKNFLLVNGVNAFSFEAFELGADIDVDTDFFVGEDGFGSFFTGDVADLYLAFGQWLDFSDPANIAKFIADGNPVDLGIDGSTPTGTAPTIFLSGDQSGFATNQGTGGELTLTGSLTNADTSPSD